MTHVWRCALHALLPSKTLLKQNMLADAGFHELKDSAVITQMHLMTLNCIQVVHTLQHCCKLAEQAMGSNRLGMCTICLLRLLRGFWDCLFVRVILAACMTMPSLVSEPVTLLLW